jgi:hypothetical protein
VTPLEALPRLKAPAGLELTWDGLQGLTVTASDAAPVVKGQRPLTLTLARTDGPHRLGMRFAGLAPDTRYRLTAWLKAGSATRIVIDVRDGPIRRKGVVLFDLEAAAMLGGTGNLAGTRIETNAEGWQEVAVESRTTDGQVFVYVGQLGPDNATVFTATAKSELTLGGVEVKAIDQLGDK